MSLLRFNKLLNRRGLDVTYHKDYGNVACPCISPEGYRNPEYHLKNPGQPVCNERGFFPDVTEFKVKAFIMPIIGYRSVQIQLVYQNFGNVDINDRIGIFPFEWNGYKLDFPNWDVHGGGDYILLPDGTKFTSINYRLVPDPHTGLLNHHYELQLRLID